MRHRPASGGNEHRALQGQASAHHVVRRQDAGHGELAIFFRSLLFRSCPSARPLAFPGTAPQSNRAATVAFLRGATAVLCCVRALAEYLYVRFGLQAGVSEAYPVFTPDDPEDW